MGQTKKDIIAAQVMAEAAKDRAEKIEHREFKAALSPAGQGKGLEKYHGARDIAREAAPLVREPLQDYMEHAEKEFGGKLHQARMGYKNIHDKAARKGE